LTDFIAVILALAYRVTPQLAGQILHCAALLSEMTNTVIAALTMTFGAETWSLVDWLFGGFDGLQAGIDTTGPHGCATC
jgi:hypothetical protein